MTLVFCHCCFSILFEFGLGFSVDFIDLKSRSGVIEVLIVLFVLQKICMICMVIWQTFFTCPTFMFIQFDCTGHQIKCSIGKYLKKQYGGIVFLRYHVFPHN